MISLSVHGGSSSPRYTVVWKKKSGPGWSAFHDLPASKYQAHYDSQYAKGYRPFMVTATGSGSSTIMAGVFVKDSKLFLATHGLRESTFHAQCSYARKTGYALTSATVYGTSSSPRYAGVWTKSTIDGWGYGIAQGWLEHQGKFKAMTDGWARPAFVTLSDSQRYLSIFCDDKIGAWIARHDMTSAQLKSYSAQFKANGYYPMCLHGGGSGSSTRYAAIWVKSETVTPRKLTVRGAYVSQLAGFDNYVQLLMAANQIRAASLAVVKEQRLVYARSFTLAEPGYPVTQPTSTFRTASLSKPITAIAVHQAFQTMKLWPGRFVHEVLQVPSNVNKDPRFRQVQMFHLLSHMGGWDRNTAFDPMGQDVAVSSWSNVPLPISKRNIFDWMTRAQTMQFSPNDNKSVYSNYGYTVLGLCLERATQNQPVASIVRTGIFKRLGLTRPQIGRSRQALRGPGEVRYHARFPNAVQSVVSSARPWVPSPYGGSNIENMDGHGAWVMAPADYAKILAALDRGQKNPLLTEQMTGYMFSSPLPNTNPNLLRGWYNTPLQNASNQTLKGYQHAGLLRGAASVALLREDGLAFVLFTNRDIKGSLRARIHGKALNDIANKVTSWPNHDLFPSVGIPGFRTWVKPNLLAYGTGCKGSNGTLVHSTAGSAEIGKSVNYRLANGPKSGVAVLYLGFSKTNWGPFRLPLALDFIGATGCRLYTGPDLQFARLTTSIGTTSFVLPIVNDPAVVGMRFFTQYVGVDKPANSLGLTYSNGIETVVGGWK